MRILFFIRGLNVGGAQRQLVATARGLKRRAHDVSVAVFYGGGLFEPEVRAAGIPLHDLAKRGRWDTVPFMTRVARLVRRERPQILYSYMGGANLFAAVLKPLFPSSVKVVWGIRTSAKDFRAYGKLSMVGHRLERLTAAIPDAVITNSRAARQVAIDEGMDERKIMVVPNGIDCERFHPDQAERRRAREAWGIRPDQPLIGTVARLVPVKGHDVLLRAAARIVETRPDARFVFVGEGAPAYKEQLARLTARLGLTERVTWAGEREVTHAVYSAFDVTVLSSNPGESFPNALIEAMASGTPCVATDTGDSAIVVGDTGAVVPSGDHDALAHSVIDVLRRRFARGSDLPERARARVVEEYSIERLASRTEEALARVLGSTASLHESGTPRT